MKKMLLLSAAPFLLFLICPLFLTGCFTTKVIHPVTALNKDDAGKTVSVPLNSLVKITLDANPTTGYLWKFYMGETEAVHCKDMPLEFVSEEFQAPNTNRMGAPGISTFVFRAVKPGPVSLEGFYFRPWEPLDRKKDTRLVFSMEVK